MEKKSFPANSQQLFKLNQFQVGIICDGDEKSPRLGTCFSFLRNDWIVTAAHVVINHGLPRQNLYAVFPNTSETVTLKVIGIHNESDIAILKIKNDINPCQFPLYPGYEDFSLSKGLVNCGYVPSKGTLVINLTRSFAKYNRERQQIETVLEFDGSNVEGGCSGGPIFGDGGVILGLMTNIFPSEEDGKTLARAVSIKSLMQAINMDFDTTVIDVFD